MNFFTRLSNGWTIAMNSFKVLKENRQLIIFPILSGISLVLIMVSFFTAVLGFSGWDLDNMPETARLPATPSCLLIILSITLSLYFSIWHLFIALRFISKEKNQASGKGSALV